MKDLMASLSRLKISVLKKIENHPGYRHIPRQQWQMDCENLRSAIKFGIPHAICPTCWGDSCDSCLKVGWIPKRKWKNLPPEMRDQA